MCVCVCVYVCMYVCMYVHYICTVCKCIVYITPVATDYTMYPFSTQNAQDYKNLLSVYTDAVFFPNLREVDFRYIQYYMCTCTYIGTCSFYICTCVCVYIYIYIYYACYVLARRYHCGCYV